MGHLHQGHAVRIGRPTQAVKSRKGSGGSGPKTWGSARVAGPRLETHFPTGGLPMRFKAMVLSAAFVALSVGAANAGSNWVGFAGGAGILTGDYGDAASPG